MRLGIVLIVLVCGVANAQGVRWVQLGTSTRGDSASVDTVGVVRADGLVNAWFQFKLANDAVVPGRDSITYSSELSRYQIECRTRTFAVVQRLYRNREGASFTDGYLRPMNAPAPTRNAPLPDSFAERVVDYFCPKDRPPSILVRNSLLAAIEISSKAGVLGTVGARQSMTLSHGGASSVTVKMIPSQYLGGQNIPSQLPTRTFSGLKQTDTIDVTNVSAGGRTYFSPVVTNTASDTITVEVANSLGTACLLVVAPNTSSEGFAIGYYLLDARAQVRFYVGSGCNGPPKIQSNPVLTNRVLPASGAVPLNYP